MCHLSRMLVLLSLLTAACASQETPKSEDPKPDEPPPLAGAVELPEQRETSASSEFWEHWGDGEAELAAYRGKIMRYGEPRDAEVVLIYVTEPHDRRTWVKKDDAPEEHRVQVLKLNHVAKFRTGIYPYSVMTSVFSPVADWGRPRFQPAKASLTAQEWCGHVFHGLWIGEDAFTSQIHSYFAGEEDARRRVDTPENTLYEDALFIQLRELDGSFADGGNWSGHLVPRLWQRRKMHDDLAPVEARIERNKAEWKDTPVTRFVLTYADQKVVYDVERADPHRLLHWSRSGGTELTLIDSERLPYWKLNKPGGQKHLEDLGITPPQGPNGPAGKSTETGSPEPDSSGNEGATQSG